MSDTVAPCGKKSQTWALLPEISLSALWLILGLGGCLWLGPLCIEAMRPDAGRVNDFFQDWGRRPQPFDWIAGLLSPFDQCPSAFGCAV